MPSPETTPAGAGDAALQLAVQTLTKQYRLAGSRWRAAKKQGAAGDAYKRALDKVSFTLGPGLYGLLGPNGAGKSTLLNIITGALPADAGQVLWNGRATTRLGRDFRRTLGYMPQQQNLYDSFTGRRFLRYLCALKEIPSTAAGAEVARVTAAVNLAGELDKRLAAYSGGMKQRLLAAGALLGNPRLLVLDEPTAGLDPRERVRLRNLMAGLKEDRIILIATHVVSDVESVADQILLLKDGQLADMAPPASLVAAHAPGGSLEDVYLHIFGDEAEGPEAPR